MQSQSERIIEKILNSQLRDESTIADHSQNPLLSEEDCVQMVIELDSNRSATIKIHAQDEPFILAKAFCFQYSIDPRVINTLANNIRNVKSMEFRKKDIDKSMIQSGVDKQNDSRIMNMSQSINDSFNKGNQSRKNKMIGESRMMKNDTTLMSNDCSRQSVFDRLYQDSRKKKVINNPMKESNRKDKKLSYSILNQSNLSNPCLSIYQKNTKVQQAALLKRQQLFKQKQDKLTQQCTFKPQINSISDLITKKLPQSYRSQLNRQKDLKRIQQYLLQKQNKQISQCTFKPKVLYKSRSRSKSAQRYKVLYEDSKLRQMKRKKSHESLQQSRKKNVMKINKISQQIVGNKSFFRRLKQDQQKRQDKKKKIENILKEQKNRRLSTGRPPHHRPQNISIGEYLYKKATNKSKDKVQNSIQKVKLTCNKSSEIYQNNKKSAFEYIFTLLDGDEDGLISNTKINVGHLSPSILSLLAPLLIQLQQMQAELDEYEFTDALNRLFNNLSISEKQIVLNVFKYKNKEFQQQPSFKPQLNEKSLLLANQNRRQHMNLYDIWKETEQQKKQRLQEIRALRILEQFQECTFHPRLFR